MYEIIARIFNGSTLIKYEVLDTRTGRQFILSIEQVQGLAMAGSIINAKFNMSTGKIEGKNDFDLRTIPRRQERIKHSNNISTNLFVGKDLKHLIEKNTRDYKERYLIKDIMSFLYSPCNGKVCALYGLRRTGKTVMMYHAIKRLIRDGHKRIVYLTLTENDSLASFYSTLEELIIKKNFEYIFIDEITAVNGFIQSSALLADKYAKLGVHIVIAGTDSYVLELAGQNNLYDRMIKISTTYIGYKEYEYLNPGTNILDYIRIGGVMPADVFYNEEKTKDYINTAISNNIINSLVRANNRKEHQLVLELNERGLLKKAIEQAISSANEILTANVITSTYHNEDLGSAKQLLESIFDIDSTLDTEEVETRVRYKLSIVKEWDAEISDEYVEELKEFLIDVGVIRMYTRYIGTKKVEVPLFIQPGLRYNQTISLINALLESPSFFNIPLDVRKKLQQKIMEDVEGNLIEHEVLLSFLTKFSEKDVVVTQLNHKGKEIDMIMQKNDMIYLFEVKRNSNIVERQYRWLQNKEFNEFIEGHFGGKIKKRTVLYSGMDEKVSLKEMDILYKNISDYIKKNG